MNAFSVILCDCPWKYEFSETKSRAIENKYTTMDVQQLCDLGAGLKAKVFAKDAAIFFWATAPKLPEALRVLKAWGFEYKTNAVWDKVKMGMGYYFRGQHEHLLVGTRGNIPAPPEQDRVPSVIREARTGHRKPAKSAIEKTKETAMRAKDRSVVLEVHGGETISAWWLEIFGRVTDGLIRPGWAVIGNEFLFSDDAPWRVRWDGLKGSAEEKLAAFDPKLAAELKAGKLTLHAAKRILLGRDCDAFAEHRISQLMLAPAPHLTLVPRLIGRNQSHYLALKCTCGARWERLTFFGCEDWYWVHCPTCHLQHSFKMLDAPADGIDCFEFKPTPANEFAEFAGEMNDCIPIRELEKAA